MSSGVGAMLRAYWLSKQREGALPKRQDIDPGEIRGLLPDLALVESLEGGRYFRFRLIGTSAERCLGHIAMRRTFDGDSERGRYRDLVAFLRRAGNTCDCLETRIPNFGDNAVYEAIEATVAPLVDQDGQPVRFLIAMEFVISASAAIEARARRMER
ncbi:PAS domain-containing protein [Minwuia thermotolerans]|uniref:PAS domain-containing protein n=1 Tax=Minwuia thermotolerans TaxID=2056226 RepID=A0A2M9FZ95_9PROT|nr:PAS domain-containing protein [Minwuia thermotolerans]PJK28786.1 hypothetical protein CVT23_15760 [Minwuia thermotolerans]